MKNDETEEQKQVRAFLRSLVIDDGPEWEIIGRTMYFRGINGVFRLDLDKGSGQYVCGVDCTFAPNNGGDKDRITLSFMELLVPTNPTNNTSYAGERAKYGLTVNMEGSNRWQWCATAIVPATLRPLHEAIEAWVAIWNAPHPRKR